MTGIRRSLLIAALALSVFVAAGRAHAAESGGFNDEYVYAMTRAVGEMDTSPALKVTIYPATLVLDTAFLPFAVIAGFVA